MFNSWLRNGMLFTSNIQKQHKRSLEDNTFHIGTMITVEGWGRDREKQERFFFFYLPEIPPVNVLLLVEQQL